VMGMTNAKGMMNTKGMNGMRNAKGTMNGYDERRRPKTCAIGILFFCFHMILSCTNYLLGY
jgi:hypothetical protein